VAKALAGWLYPAEVNDAEEHTAWDVLRLGSVNEQDATLRPFVAQLANRGLLVYPRSRSSCWRVHLPQSWDDYLAMLSKSHRKQVRRLERKYFVQSRAHLHMAQTPQQVEYGLDVLRRLHQRRRESLGDRGCFASPRFAAFHAQTAPRLLAANQLRLVWLDVDGRTVAAEYQVLGDGVVYAYQSGLEPDALHHEPGRLITLAMLKLAIAERYHAYDFLRGDEAYKAHWRAVPRPTLEVRLAIDTPVARLRQGMWWAGGLLRSWLRREKPASRELTAPAQVLMSKSDPTSSLETNR
jgi:CelD/BcsL family acetyltransferase involved in cellulose biosynthesis